MNNFLFSMPKAQLEYDLKYWGDKLKYAESLPAGTKRDNFIRVSRMMIDMYLDRWNNLKKNLVA